MTRRGISTLILFLVGSAVFAEPFAPQDLPGLVAWYDARSLYGEHVKLRDGETVVAWPDSSGNGHDLRAEARGLPAVFRTIKLNELPLVELQERSSFLVSDPFDLQDHTIVLVSATGTKDRALFSSEADEQSGIVLNTEGGVHRIRAGLKSWAYNSAQTAEGFSVTALSREAGVLRAQINGNPLAGDAQDAAVLRVGRMFHIRLSRAVERDARGMSVAELLIFDRRLNDDELTLLTGHLAAKYGIGAGPSGPASRENAGEAEPFDWSRAEVLARLSTISEPNLNVPAGKAVEWNAPSEVTPPFRHDPANHPSRLYCTRDKTTVRLAVILELQASVAGAELRIGTVKNGGDYLKHVQVTQTTAGGAGDLRLSARYEVSVTLDADDYVEIFVARNAADGTVSSLPLGSFLLAAVE